MNCRAQEDRKFKEKPDDKWTKRSGGLRARHYLATLQNCEKKLKENITSQESIQNGKLIQMKLKKEAKLQSCKAAKPGSFSPVILALETRVQERVCEISLRARKSTDARCMSGASLHGGSVLKEMLLVGSRPSG